VQFDVPRHGTVGFFVRLTGGKWWSYEGATRCY